jgi:hypothetical protein
VRLEEVKLHGRDGNGAEPPVPHNISSVVMKWTGKPKRSFVGSAHD